MTILSGRKGTKIAIDPCEKEVKHGASRKVTLPLRPQILPARPE